MDAQELARRREGDVELVAVLGDMTREEVDAIVNAANTHLAHGGGLAGAIVRAGGEVIQEESDRIAPVPVGGAKATSAGNLPCRWVIHAVGPRWGEGDEEAKLRSAVRASLDEAARLRARSVSLPAISTGIFGYPVAEGVATLVDETRRWLASNPDGGLQEVHFTSFTRDTAGLFAARLEGRES